MPGQFPISMSDLTIPIVYLAASRLLAIWLVRGGSKNADGFFLGGCNVVWLLIGWRWWRRSPPPSTRSPSIRREETLALKGTPWWQNWRHLSIVLLLTTAAPSGETGKGGFHALPTQAADGRRRGPRRGHSHGAGVEIDWVKTADNSNDYVRFMDTEFEADAADIGLFGADVIAATCWKLPTSPGRPPPGTIWPARPAS